MPVVVLSTPVALSALLPPRAGLGPARRRRNQHGRAPRSDGGRADGVSAGNGVARGPAVGSSGVYVGRGGERRRSVGTDGESDPVEAAGQGCALLQSGGPAEEPIFRCGCGHGGGA